MADADAIIKTPFFEGDTITLRCVFKIDGVEQTPDSGSAYIEIIDSETGEEKLSRTSASDLGNDIYYKWSNVSVGRYRAFFTASFNIGEDTRTGTLDFTVENKGL